MDPIKVVEAFGAAWADHDLDAALAMVTDDCVFDATGPAPDGTRCVGVDAIRAVWAADLRRPELPIRGGGNLPGRRPGGATVALQLRRRARARR